MRDEDKPFVCVKGPGSIKIAPRNARGWKALTFWMLAMLAQSALFFWAIFSPWGQHHVIGLTAGYVLASTIWAVAMIRWMMARSEMVDIQELLAIKRERDRAGGRRG